MAATAELTPIVLASLRNVKALLDDGIFDRTQFDKYAASALAAHAGRHTPAAVAAFACAASRAAAAIASAAAPPPSGAERAAAAIASTAPPPPPPAAAHKVTAQRCTRLLYTSDAADE